MKQLFFLLTMLGIISSCTTPSGNQSDGNVVLVIHGGAGTILKENMTPELEAQYIAVLTSSLQAGYDTLQKGASSLDAIETAILIMEDSPLFNAGVGAVFTNEGKNELDAAIMDGKTLAAGAVAGLTTVRNPVLAARAVMEKSNHVMMIGAGAEKFAREAGLVMVDPSYFYTENRWNGLQRALEKEKMELDHADTTASIRNYYSPDYKFGTVGACALDNYGNLAAATSTGGMTNKRYGRVGDVPIIGAGTYANNRTAAISCTGWGEYFIRSVVAHDISAMMEYGKLSLNDAANKVMMEKVPALGGDGGLIGLDAKGNVTMPFNTPGMYRGYITKDGKVVVKIFKD